MTRASLCLLLGGLFAAERLVELALTRRNVRRLRPEILETADTRAEYTGMVALHVAFLVLPLVEVALRGARGPAALAWTAGGVLAAAQALRYWSIASLGPLWNARAAIDPARGFTTRGPYRYLRHPNYLAVALEFLAFPLVGGAWLSWIALNVGNAVVLSGRIRREEALLARIPGYREAMSGKGALLPRVRFGTSPPAPE
jgi:methyltransferase